MKRWKNWEVYTVVDLCMYVWVSASIGRYLAACYKYEVLTGGEAIGYGALMPIAMGMVEKFDMWVSSNRHNAYKGAK